MHSLNLHINIQPRSHESNASFIRTWCLYTRNQNCHVAQPPFFTNQGKTQVRDSVRPRWSLMPGHTQPPVHRAAPPSSVPGQTGRYTPDKPMNKWINMNSVYHINHFSTSFLFHSLKHIESAGPYAFKQLLIQSTDSSEDGNQTNDPSNTTVTSSSSDWLGRELRYTPRMAHSLAVSFYIILVSFLNKSALIDVWRYLRI